MPLSFWKWPFYLHYIDKIYKVNKVTCVYGVNDFLTLGFWATLEAMYKALGKNCSLHQNSLSKCGKSS